MHDPLKYPRLRFPIDARMEHIQNQDVVVLRCPIGVAKQPLVLNAVVGPVLSCFNGDNSTEDILQRFQPHGLTPEILAEIITLVDHHLFLDTPNFTAAYDKLKQDFHNAPIRPAALAGTGYPAGERDLQNLVDQYLASNGAARTRGGQLTALIAPHIDYRRGGVSYGLAYNALKGEKHDLYVLLGTAHQYSPHIFHLTRKDFQNPLGLSACDRELADSVAAAYGARSFADEILHQSEHSIELQLPFLTRLQPDSRILPILVGSYHHMLCSGKLPQDFEEYEVFAAALARGLADRTAAGKKVCLIAGADMAHVGRNFGDENSLTPEFMRQIAEHDENYLQAALACDTTSLFAHMCRDQDARRICGFPAVYLMLDLLNRLGLCKDAEVLDYRQAVDYQADCAVTFAGVAFYSG